MNLNIQKKFILHLIPKCRYHRLHHHPTVDAKIVLLRIQDDHCRNPIEHNQSLNEIKIFILKLNYICKIVNKPSIVFVGTFTLISTELGDKHSVIEKDSDGC